MLTIVTKIRRNRSKEYSALYFIVKTRSRFSLKANKLIAKAK